MLQCVWFMLSLAANTWAVLLTMTTAATLTRARVHSAMSAYSPIAIIVFGDLLFSVQVRLLLARSLVFSHLLQGTQAWSAVSLWSFKKLNTVCMRVLRRIAAKVRFDSSCGMTDRQVRVLLNMPAIEMLISPLQSRSFVPCSVSEIRKASLCQGCNSCSRIFGC